MPFYDRAWMSIASGANPITLGSALVGYRSFSAAGVADQANCSYTIVDGTNWETGQGTYTASGTTFSRRPQATSAGGTTLIPLTANATIFLDVLASDMANLASLVTTASQTFAGGVTSPTLTATTSVAVNYRDNPGSGAVIYANASALRLYVGADVLVLSNTQGTLNVPLSINSSAVVGSSLAPFSRFMSATGDDPQQGQTSAWDFRYSIFGAISSSTSAALGISSSSSAKTINLTALAPSVAWQGFLYSASQHQWWTFGVGSVAMTLDTYGNLLVGVASGTAHRINKAVAENTNVLTLGGSSDFVYFSYGSGPAGSTAASVLNLSRNSSNSRSINAGGTINASGADYAEYMTRSEGCGTIAKGDVCGVDASGHLVTTWADAISFKIKSTDPNLVGGDSWAAHLDDRPQEPVLILPAYDGPPEPVEPDPMPEGVADTEPYADTHLAYEANLAEYEAAQAVHATAVSDAQTAHSAAHAQWKTDLATFETALEAARQTVDRIAYCGQVPVNFAGTCQPGDYLVAVRSGDGIGLAAVATVDMTIGQYMQRVGRVLAIRDNRPWIDVQHG